VRNAEVKCKITSKIRNCYGKYEIYTMRLTPFSTYQTLHYYLNVLSNVTDFRIVTEIIRSI